MIVGTRQYAPGLGDVASDTWPSTGEIDTETTSLWNSMMQLSQDWFDTQSPGWTAQLQNAWNAFVADFTNWKNSSYFWNPGRRDELLDYRKRFNTFVTNFTAAGVSTDVTPAQVGSTVILPSGLDSVVSSASGLLTKALYVVLGVGVLWAGMTVYKETRGR